jgi:hypothetical protein
MKLKLKAERREQAQRHKGTEAQRHKGTEAQRHRGTKAFMPFRVQRFNTEKLEYWSSVSKQNC